MRYLFLAFLGLLFFNFLSAAYAMNFSSYWNFSKNSDSKLKKDQGYFFSFSKSLTSRMNFGGSLNYMKTQTDDTWRENLSPSFYYNIINDLFNYNLGYSYRLIELSDDRNFKNWGISQNFRTAIKKFIISLYWNKNRNWTEGLKNNLKSTNTGMGFSINRRFDEGYFKGFSTMFDYRITKNKDNVSGSKMKNVISTFKIGYSKSFKNIEFGVNQEFYKTKIKATYQLGPNGKYRVEYPLSLYNGTFNSTLKVGDTFYIQLSNDKILEGIEFYTDYSILQKIGNNVRWDIYYSKDKINWTLIATNITLPYEISPSLSYPNIYIKLEVKYITGTVNLTNPKFMGYYYETERHYERENKIYRTSAHLNIKLPYRMFLNTSSGYEDYKFEINPNIKRYYYNINFSWGGNRYFRPNISYFYTIDKQEEIRENKFQGYSLSISSIPYKTIKLSSGYTYTKSWTNGTAVLENKNLFFSEYFEIYPELTTVLSQSYSKLSNLEQGNENKAYSMQINILARLRPSITLEVRNSFIKSETSEEGEAFSRRHEIFLAWRISNFSSFSTFYMYTKSEDTSTYSYSYTFYIAPTQKIRMNLSYNGFKTNGSKETNLGFNTFWTVTSKLNLNWNYNYNYTQDSDKNSWSWFLSIRYVF